MLEQCGVMHCMLPRGTTRQFSIPQICILCDGAEPGVNDRGVTCNSEPVPWVGAPVSVAKIGVEINPKHSSRDSAISTTRQHVQTKIWIGSRRAEFIDPKSYENARPCNPTKESQPPALPPQPATESEVHARP